MTQDIPHPEIIELSNDWLPWKFQIVTYGDGASYGSSTQVVRTGWANFETRESAERAFVIRGYDRTK